jgi:hypothetical protein
MQPSASTQHDGEWLDYPKIIFHQYFQVKKKETMRNEQQGISVINSCIEFNSLGF